MADAERTGFGRRSWDADKERLFEEMEKLDARLHVLNDQVTLLRIDVGKLSVKAGIWGALAGAATVAIPLIGLLLATGGLQP